MRLITQEKNQFMRLSLASVCPRPRARESVARLLPYERRHAELIGSLSHKVKVRGDIFSTGPEWEAGAES